jgi:DNA (cytosine-5)-methyltransferase 1
MMDGNLAPLQIKESPRHSQPVGLGEHIRSARVAKGISKTRLAELASLDVATVGEIERGRGTLAPLVAVMKELDVQFVQQKQGTPLGRWLGDERRLRTLTQHQFALAIGVSKPTVIALEQGRGSVSTLSKALAALSLDTRLTGRPKASQQGIRYATLCSGIESISQAWMPLGWEPVFFAENAEFPSAVLRHRHPLVPNLGDVTLLDGSAWKGLVDVLWASTPCTSFSMAGDRQGLDSVDGALTREFARLCDEIEPDVLVWENVKGALVDDGNAFGDLLGRLVGEECPLQPAGDRWTNAGFVLGPKRAIAWRVLDAQYAALAQRRERLFLVGCRRDGLDPRDLLFERNGAGGHRPAMRTPRHEHSDRSGQGIVYVNGDARPKVSIGIANTLKADTGSGGRACILQNGRVRRLMPVEWERLMGLEDDTTAIRWKGKPAPDTLRWQAIGNAVAVPDVRWIGHRIQGSLRVATDFGNAEF